MNSNQLGRQTHVGGFFKKLLLDYNTILMLIVLIIISSIVSDKFFTANNILNLLRQNAGAMIAAMGMLFVILTGGIDLSIGSIAAVGSVMVATCLSTLNLGLFPAILLSLVIGLLFGLFNGVMVAVVKMAPFIATLAMMTIAKGVALMISNGSPVKTPTGTLDAMGTAKVGPISGLIVIAIIVVIVFFLIHKYTGFGRLVVAIGSNSSAVRLAGIQTNRYVISVYVISALCAIAAGIITAARTYLGNPTAGDGLEMDAIAAVVIGGGSLAGGRGYVFRTLAGVIILGLISNIMNLVGVPPYPQEIVKGFIIIGAVVLQSVTDKRS